MAIQHKDRHSKVLPNLKNIKDLQAQTRAGSHTLNWQGHKLEWNQQPKQLRNNWWLWITMPIEKWH